MLEMPKDRERLVVCVSDHGGCRKGWDSLVEVGRAGTLLPESKQFTEALTDNYLPLLVRGKHDPNRWLRVLIEGVRDGKLVGA